MKNEQTETDELNKEMRNIIEEARVILPGIQALFGFQTISVFNERFATLPSYVKDCHLGGLGMIIIAIALVMTPAVYHRTVGRENVSQRMVRISSFLICAALAPLALGLALDIFTVIFVASDNPAGSVMGALVTLLFLSGLWFAFPLGSRKRARKFHAH
jgi:hypothetical protein